MNFFLYYFILTLTVCLNYLITIIVKKKQKKNKLFSRTNLSKRKSVCNYIFRVPLVDDRRRTFIHSSSKNAFNSSWCNLMGCPNNNNNNLAGTPMIRRCVTMFKLETTWMIGWNFFEFDDTL